MNDYSRMEELRLHPHLAYVRETCPMSSSSMYAFSSFCLMTRTISKH